MEIIIRIGQFLLSLSILVILHELGHFVFARLFKTRVEKFYMFFNPWFSLFKIKKGDTEYGIGWLPLGGYVKISGMIDESMDKEQMKQAPKPYEFRSKPTWQRLLIILAGVMVNLVLACFLYIAILFTWGEQYLPPENAKHGIVCDSLSQTIGLQNGDKILTVDNEKVEKFSGIIGKILIDNAQSLQIERNGELLEIQIPDTYKKTLLARSNFKRSAPPISPRELFAPFVIAEVAKNTPAKVGMLQKGDELLSIDGQVFHYYDEFKTYLTNHLNQTIQLQVKREGNPITLAVNMEEAPILGVKVDGSQRETPGFVVKHYSLLEAIPAGIKKGYDTLKDYIRSMSLLFSPEGMNAIGGFGTIMSIFPPSWNWHTFWNLTAFLSVMLAFLNVLPIPALDGGHAMFILYEMITGRKPGEKFMEYAQIVGIILLLSLVVYANGNDIFKFLSS